MMGNLAEVRAATSGRAIGEIVDYDGANPLNAEIVPGCDAAWYLVEVHPAHERIACAHLSGRRFGIYLPETEASEIKRGRKVERLRPMFPGYIFVFLWDLGRHMRRVLACPGTSRFVVNGDRPAVICDGMIDRIRAVENKERPLTLKMEVVARPQKRWRNRKVERWVHEQIVSDNEIVSVRTWSAFTDGIEAAVDGEERNQLLRRALGLA